MCLTFTFPPRDWVLPSRTRTVALHTVCATLVCDAVVWNDIPCVPLTTLLLQRRRLYLTCLLYRAPVRRLFHLPADASNRRVAIPGCVMPYSCRPAHGCRRYQLAVSFSNPTTGSHRPAAVLPVYVGQPPTTTACSGSRCAARHAAAWIQLVFLLSVLQACLPLGSAAGLTTLTPPTHPTPHHKTRLHSTAFYSTFHLPRICHVCGLTLTSDVGHMTRPVPRTRRHAARRRVLRARV